MIRMNDAQDFALSDGTTVRFLVEPAGRPVSDAERAPDGMGPLVPVSRNRRADAAVAAALRATLQPLGSLVQDVHDAVVTGATPPGEVSVTFGVQLGHDLKLGIVSGSGQAHLTVTATWKPEQGQGQGQASAS
ncbi:CU044_2847 family protein [Streptomyces sp. NPDC006624]|uniref:CU044_2847 family protein n=1 Tax=Streptomyces sp. NPDC006624 TaxID=3154892 RepID=UPI0033A401B8